jgi:adenylate cyclase
MNDRSCAEAVACTVAIQCDMVQNTASVSSDRRIEFRVGINLGDAIVDEDDTHGDRVNVADVGGAVSNRMA